MTNKEALIAVIQVSVPDNSADKVLLDADIDGTADYSKDNEQSIDFCAIELLKGLLAVPNVSEGGYSVQYDKAAIETRLTYLNQKYGIVDATRIVRGVQPW